MTAAANAAQRTPIFLLSGFLGSGKTTLLNALLKHPAFTDTAVIVNEFGEIGLDQLLIAQASDNVVLLEAGCLCCTISDSLHETLADLNFRRVRGEVPAFRRVIVETTGLADPAPLVNTLLGNRMVTDHYVLAAVVVTVDAEHASSLLTTYGEVARQIAVADCLVVTKADRVDGVDALMAQLRRLNPEARVLRSRRGDVAGEAFAAGAPRRVGAGRVASPPVEAGDGTPRVRRGMSPLAYRGAESARAFAHPTGIEAHSFILSRPPSWAGLAAWWRLLVELCGERLLRCKGLLEIEDSGEIVFVQGVQAILHAPERLPGWPDDDHRSRLVCITRDVRRDDLSVILPALDLPPGSDPHLTIDGLSAKESHE